MRTLVVSLSLAGFLSAPSVDAQQAVRTNTEEQTRIILDVTRVNLLFTVTDKKGRFVTDLTKDDFLVREGKRPQKILEFTAETELPLRLAILVDTSNSIKDRFKFIQEAAIEFINSVVRPQQDRVAVVSFDTAAELQALRRAVKKFFPSFARLRDTQVQLLWVDKHRRRFPEIGPFRKALTRLEQTDPLAAQLVLEVVLRLFPDDPDPQRAHALVGPLKR